MPELGEKHTGNTFDGGNEPRPGHVMAFVGWQGFRVDDGGIWSDHSRRFWNQMSWIEPDLYVSEGRYYLTLVCREERLFAAVLEGLSSG